MNILIIFGNIDFAADGKEATINEIDAAFSSVYENKEKASDFAEMWMKKQGYASYLIPQYFPGNIIWCK